MADGAGAHRARGRGARRRRQLEFEETAVGVLGPVIVQANGQHNQWEDWRYGNINHMLPTATTSVRVLDNGVIITLRASGRVANAELCIFHIPDALLHRYPPSIDQLNDRIIDGINDWARTRRQLLHLQLRRRFQTEQGRQLVLKLLRLPSEIQELQGEILEAGGRYVRVPPVFSTEVALLTK